MSKQPSRRHEPVRKKTLLENRPYGIQGQQFPFRPRVAKPGDTEEFILEIAKDADFLREESGVVLLGIDDMIYKRVRSHLKNNQDENTVDEIVQQCRQNIWARSLPKFDSTRGVKLTTFLYACIDNFVRQALRELSRGAARRHEIYADPECMGQTLADHDHSQDRNVEAIAQDILDNPHLYLTKKQEAVFRNKVGNPKQMVKDLAVQLDYRQASSLSMMIRRVKDRVGEVSIEDGPRSSQK